MNEFEGVIKTIGKKEIVGSNNLEKMTFVLEENSDKEFKSSMAIDLFNDKIELLIDCKVGDIIKAGLNFRAREYNGRWFNSVGAWKIDKIGGSASQTRGATMQDVADDLPF